MHAADLLRNGAIVLIAAKRPSIEINRMQRGLVEELHRDPPSLMARGEGSGR
ncbi:hypothetical protein [Microbacterium sp. NPDC087589]|uniref:hypothetical protein n=1 Tax=Microbacterium sp. NPDC087589 TaxID=3364191 RepID=UPI0038154E4E